MPALREELSSRELEILGFISEGASDKEIAKEFYLSVNTVKWHNRQIYQKLDVENRTQAVAVANQEGLLEDQGEPSSTDPSNPKRNLPEQLSSFIGREEEISEIVELLDNTRLLTLTGPGGIGKTRLSLKVAEEYLNDQALKFGVFFVGLASLSEPDLIGNEIVEVLGLHQESDLSVEETITKYLAGNQTFLVLDNFEHLLDGARIVKTLLESSADLKILATSREALNLSGEQIFHVPVLSIPKNTDFNSIHGLEKFEAVQLFTSRVKSYLPDFEPSNQELSIIAEICLHLDGLPLAIELAAARMKMLNLQELLFQLGDRYVLLTDSPRDAPERHQTLQKAIDWSYQLLTDSEKVLFRRLAVFQDSRSLHAIEQVCCADLSLKAMEGISSFVDKNLIKKENGLDGEVRFYFLESIHDFAHMKLLGSGEEEKIREQHANYFIGIAEEAKAKRIRGSDIDIRHWRFRINADLNNFRSMVNWAIQGGDELVGLRAVASLFHYSGHFAVNEWMNWVDWATENIHVAPKRLQANIHLAAGKVDFRLKNFDRCTESYKEALEIYTDLESINGMALMNIYLMESYMLNSDRRSEILYHYKKAIPLLEENNDITGIGYAHNAYGIFESMSGNIQKSNEAFFKTLKIANDTDDLALKSISMINLGCNHYDDEKPREAYKYTIQALKLILGDKSVFSYGQKIRDIANVAGPLAALGEPKRAVVLLSAVDSLCKKEGISFKPAQELDFVSYHEHAKALLDDRDYHQAWEEGQRMAYEEAVDYALDETIFP